MNLVLIGFMGVGKTSVGSALARRLGRPFFDTDSLIETLYGMPVSEIFAEYGEAFFRAAEKRVVEEVAGRPRSVIATGGGVVLDRQNVDRLRRCGLLIHLTLSPLTIFHRIGHEGKRPLLETETPRQTLEKLFSARERLYSTCSDLTIDRSGQGVDETVESVLAAVSPRGVSETHRRQRERN